jgi:Mor family transcriptional regulator
MKKELVPIPKNPVPAAFSYLGVGDVTPRDDFSLTCKSGILKASVKRQSGECITITKRIKGGFDEMTVFDPESMSKTARNKLIKEFYEKGDTQKELEKKFGLTQAMISRIINS